MAMAASSLSSYGGQNVMMMRNDMGSSNSLVAMLSACNPHVGFQVPRSTGGLEDAIAGCGQKRPYYPTFEGGALEEPDEDVDEDLGFSHPVEKKRRLSFDQVRSLERNFEMENKLEPERKMQLAKELGLQPRQVAVWFQNRRARWKTKQLERDYEMLNSGYLKLKADFETALREKDALKAEVQRLSGNKTTSNQDSQSVDSSQCKSELAHCSPPTDPSKTNAKCSPTIELCKEKEDSTVDSSSELLDTDSPRTTASNHLSGLQEELACDFPPESFGGPGEPFPVKLEDGCGFQVDPNCNYFLPPMLERGVLPWWDWA
ncbi:hypothetical protein M758_10G025500 [Ceratodon purpureus]|uniref:Homeobox domain-containing protein n=1 Tax=Ceratodon purpureus TaxID=3225 RepID=A0A8T0GIL4_CERPU|nr:hypothetical protein KC19_10G027200 [Ceratodon purpureus]KAG0602590.1 hypothetical protein M758_10G025500 [Ceratodon purpureus]